MKENKNKKGIVGEEFEEQEIERRRGRGRGSRRK